MHLCELESREGIAPADERLHDSVLEWLTHELLASRTTESKFLEAIHWHIVLEEKQSEHFIQSSCRGFHNIFYLNCGNRLLCLNLLPDRVLHAGLPPLFAALGDYFVVHADLRVDDLNLYIRVFKCERDIKIRVILDRLLVHIEEELAEILIKIDVGFDATFLVRKSHWEDHIDLVERNLLEVLLLVEDDFKGLALGSVLGIQRVLDTIHEEIEDVGPDNTSSRL